MAAVPTATTTKPKRVIKRGPPKDKVLYLVFKGEFTQAPEVVENLGVDFVDRMMSDRELKYTKITLKAKTRKPREAADTVKDSASTA